MKQVFLFIGLSFTIVCFSQLNNINAFKTNLSVLNISNDSRILSIQYINMANDSLQVNNHFRFKNEMTEKNIATFHINDVIGFEYNNNRIQILCKKNTIKNSFFDLNNFVKTENVSSVSFPTSASINELETLKKGFKRIILLNTQVDFASKSWEETMSYIKSSKDSLLDFHYYTPKNLQKVVVKDNNLILKVDGNKLKYLQEASFKDLIEVKNYKRDGLLLNFGWKNKILKVYNKQTNSFTKIQKSMHLAIKINDPILKQNLHSAFKRFIVLNKEKK
jgi:hypothetical protein